MNTKKGNRGLTAAIDEILDNRIYRPQTVDAVLEDNAILLTEEVFEHFERAPDYGEYRLEELRHRRFLLATLVDRLGKPGDTIEILNALAEFCAHLDELFPSLEHSNAKGYYGSPTGFWWGGTEEMVIAKGSDWCTEVARTFAALVQVAGIPSRIVYTLLQEDGHVITECFTSQGWLLVDPLTAKLCTRRYGSPISAVDMTRADGAKRAEYTFGREGYYVHESFFEFISISEYRLMEAENYDYGVSYYNEYYRKLLEQIWNK